MFERDDRIYYERRAREATALGDGAANPKVAALHHELALRFSILSIQASETTADVLALRKGRKSAPPELARLVSDVPKLEPMLRQG